MEYIKNPTSTLEWKSAFSDKIVTNKKGFAHVLVFDGTHVFPCIYNKLTNTFSCGKLYVRNVIKFAYMPKVIKMFVDE